MRKKVLVTGAAGGVGRYVVKELEASYDLILTDMAEPSYEFEGKFVKADITHIEEVLSVVSELDAIIHLAAIPVFTEENIKIANVNIMGTLNILEAARLTGVRNLVLTSSICATGFIFNKTEIVPSYIPINEEHPSIPDDSYGFSKRIVEEIAIAYANRYDLRCTCLRLATVWLPDHQETNELLEILSDKDRFYESYFADLHWQYVDVRDVAQAFRLSLEREGSNFEVYNVGAGDTPSEDAIKLAAHIYPGVPLLKDPSRFINKPDTPLWDIQKIQQQLGYAPKYSWREYESFKPPV